MKIKLIFVCVLVVSVALASSVQKPKRSTILYDPILNAAVFEFVPTPKYCDLQIVASNVLVWRKRTWPARVSARGQPVSGSDTTAFYIQKRIGEKPARIIQFSGCKATSVVRVSDLGSLLFEDGEEFIVPGDASTHTPDVVSAFFRADIRSNCIFQVSAHATPSTFKNRLRYENTPSFKLSVFKKGQGGKMREIEVKAFPNEQDSVWHDLVSSGELPTMEWIYNLWPIVEFDDNGFTIWNGSEWVKFKWDDNRALEGIQQSADGQSKPTL